MFALNSSSLLAIHLLISTAISCVLVKKHKQIGRIDDYLAAIFLVGAVIQTRNNFVSDWDTIHFTALLIYVIPIAIALGSIQGPNSPSRRGYLRKCIKIISGVLVVAVFYFFVLKFAREIAFLHLTSGEDNSKWINSVFHLQSSQITATDVNGVSGPVIFLLFITTKCLQFVNQIFQQNASNDIITILTPFVAEITLVASIMYLAWKQLYFGASTDDVDQSKAHRLSATALLLMLLIVLINTFSFGFLTFNMATAGVLLAIRMLHSIDLTSENRRLGAVALILLLLITLNFVWLPLSILLAPVELIALAYFTWLLFAGRLWYSMFLLLSVFISTYVYVVEPRLNYFFSIGSGGQPVWKELALSGGGTPALSLSLITAAAIYIGYRIWLLDESKLSGKLLLYSSGIIVVTFSLISLISTSLGNQGGYAATKLGLFVFLILLLVGSQLHPLMSNRKSSLVLSFLVFFILIMGGDLNQSYSRLVVPLQKSSLSEVDAIWVGAVVNELEETGKAPVGCLTITSTESLVKSENSRDYLCTRILTNLAGGEERLIGLHAFTTGVFNASQMYGSLEHYLGTDLDEIVLLFSEETNSLVQRVSLLELKKFVNMTS